MALGWIDTTNIPFAVVSLLESEQIRWMTKYDLESSLSIALKANAEIAWIWKKKCPEAAKWIDDIMSLDSASHAPEEVRKHEKTVLDEIQDWIVYAIDPAIYDSMDFLKWDSNELLMLTDFTGKTVLDIGAGTGRLAFTVSSIARNVFACEPVANLRRYMRQKAKELSAGSVFVIDGLITQIPFPEGSFDVTMGGHVFGDEPRNEIAEMERVTKVNGMVILCPGNNDKDDKKHKLLVERGYEWSLFEEPTDGIKRKYWKCMRS